MFLSTNKKVTGFWNSEVGSMKPREKAKDILFHPWNTTYIFTAVKIQLFIFSQLWNTAFLKYALYLIHNFLYFITLYIIKKENNKIWNLWKMALVLYFLRIHTFTKLHIFSLYIMYTENYYRLVWFNFYFRWRCECQCECSTMLR